MAATIIVEDGSIVNNANSYITVAEAKAYASDRNVTLGADAEVESQLVVAKDYLESKRAEYQGYKTNAEIDGTEKAQALQWPRTGVYLDCSTTMLDANTIPTELKDAQAQLVIEQFNGVALTPTQTGRFVTEEQVGPLKTKYSDQIGTSGQPYLTAVDSLLGPLYSSCGTTALKTIRV